jgi:hypothetical protein
MLAPLAVVSGCGDAGAAPTVEVNGVITYQGKPVPNVNVTFTPTTGRPATGTTNESGEFTLSTFGEGDGAVPGTHTVTLSTTEIPPMPGTPEAEQAAAATPPFPAKYSSPTTSDQKVEVKEGTNDLKIELTD